MCPIEVIGFYRVLVLRLPSFCSGWWIKWAFQPVFTGFSFRFTGFSMRIGDFYAVYWVLLGFISGTFPFQRPMGFWGTDVCVCVCVCEIVPEFVKYLCVLTRAVLRTTNGRREITNGRAGRTFRGLNIYAPIRRLEHLVPGTEFGFWFSTRSLSHQRNENVNRKKSAFGPRFLTFSGFDWVWLGLTEFYWVFHGFDCVWQGLTWFYCVLLGFTGFYWIFTGLHWVLLGFIVF